MEEKTPATLVEMSIDSVKAPFAQEEGPESQRVVFLKVRAGNVVLPILMGATEGDNVMIALEGIALPRPLSPDLLVDVINKLDAHVDKVVISDVRDDTFYVKIVLSAADGEKVEVDSTPYEALALALRSGAPLYAAEPVLKDAGITGEG